MLNLLYYANKHVSAVLQNIVDSQNDQRPRNMNFKGYAHFVMLAFTRNAN